ncbi:MAG TPA: hypothetical protein VKY81_09515 [Natronosporangium sp.]|nr:hypothetical protein [Natronosporangium sp.]
MSRYGPADEGPQVPGEGYGSPSDPWDQPADLWRGPTVPPPHRPSGERPTRPPSPGWSSYPEDPGPARSAWPDVPPSDDPTRTDLPPWPGGSTPPTRPGRPARGGRPPRRRSGLLILLMVVLVLVVAGGVWATLRWVSDEPDRQLSGPGAPDGGSSPSAAADGGEQAEVPDDRTGMGPVVAQPGDCLVNEGTVSEPAMRIVPCDTDEDTAVYRVLARFNEQVSGETPEEQDRSAQEICLGTENYEVHYRFVAADPEDSFVLCLDQR